MMSLKKIVLNNLVSRLQRCLSPEVYPHICLDTQKMIDDVSFGSIPKLFQLERDNDKGDIFFPPPGQIGQRELDLIVHDIISFEN